jgi:toxin ParE1/3/4
MKPYRLREKALIDVTDAADHYIEIPEELAHGFSEELLDALGHVSRLAGTGSPRYSELLPRDPDNQPLRFWLLSRFPYAVFYVERGDHIDVIRVLHQASNIPRYF